jgi:hypothetical protein
MFGEGRTQAGVSPTRSARGGPRASLDPHRHDVQLAAERALDVRPARELPRRHPVARRNGTKADEREEPLLREVPLDGEAAERVRAVQDEDRLPRRGARLQDEERRPDERVVAGADVGEVADDGVESGEVLGPRREVLEALAVERDDGEPPFGVSSSPTASMSWTAPSARAPGRRGASGRGRRRGGRGPPGRSATSPRPGSRRGRASGPGAGTGLPGGRRGRRGGGVSSFGCSRRAKRRDRGAR